MKKTLIIILVLSFVLLLVGCDSNNQENAEVNSYKEMAQSFIDEGNYDSAVKTLEQGISVTNSAELKSMLYDIKSMFESDNSNVGDSDYLDSAITEEDNPLTVFVGSYSDNASWHYGGTIIDITTNGNQLNIEYSLYQGAPTSNIAMISTSFDIEDSKITIFEFDFEDNWENKGTMILEFINDDGEKCVKCEIKNLESNMLASWGVYEGAELLHLDENVHSRMEYTEEDYEKWEHLGFPAYNLNTGEYELIKDEVSDSTSEGWNQHEDPKLSSYYGNDISYVAGEVIIRPKYIYWVEDTLVAECFIINGCANSVNNIDIKSFAIENSYGIIAEGEFGLLNNLTLEPYAYAVWTLNFVTGVSQTDAFLNEPIYWSYSTSWSNIQTYNTSKASEILLNMGVSEEEFKRNCTYIGSRYDTTNEIVFVVGKEYYSEHPEDSAPQDYERYWKDYLANGKASQYYTIERAEYFDNCKTLEEFLNIMVYGKKGASILGSISEDIVNEMVEYPDKYVGKTFLLNYFTADNIHDYVYYCDWFLGMSVPFIIYDYRDNVKNPTIMENDKYDMYVIFLGNNMQYNEISLEFALITLEKYK